jgi:hypothetical protein
MPQKILEQCCEFAALYIFVRAGRKSQRPGGIPPQIKPIRGNQGRFMRQCVSFSGRCAKVGAQFR